MRAVGMAAALVLASWSEAGVSAEPVAATPSARPSPAGRYAPRDECRELPGAGEFRARLALAVRERNAEGLAALAADDVKLDFGDGAGRAELVARLGRADGELWSALEELLTLGCAADEAGEITLPWYFAQKIEIDPYDGMIVTGESVPLLPLADLTQPPLDMLDWDVVELVAGLYPERPYQQVRFGTQEGYVATKRLRSLIDYRLIAARVDGGWKITALIAGD